MEKIIINALKERIRSLVPFKEEYFNICIDFDIYYDAFFSKDEKIPICDDSEVSYKVMSKGEWGFKENEFYAEKTRRAISKLSDRDLAKIG